MVIAVNLRTLSGNDESANFLEECFKKIAILNPGAQFIFITEKKFPEAHSFQQNIKQIVIEQTSSNPLLWKLWYNYKLPAVLKKYHADILINADGVGSLRTKLPQCLFINDVSFQHHPAGYSKKYLRFAKVATRHFLKKANIIIAGSHFLKEQIVKDCKIDSPKIEVVYPFLLTKNKTIDAEMKESIKEKYTEGREYFFADCYLVEGKIHPGSNLINLLKAFSFFKKRQKSNMQLVINVPKILSNDPFMECLRLFKFRREVKIVTNLPGDELQKVTAAAYAFMRPALAENHFGALLQAMQCEVPVICSNGGVAMETFADAALYVNPENHEDIADKMMLLFKDENKRKDLIQKGLGASSKYNAEKTAAQFAKIIFAAIQPV